MRRRRLVGLLLATSLVAVGCARPRPDPMEGLNRPIFGFNEAVDERLWDPARRGWEWATPRLLRDGIANVFRNLSVVGVFVNDVLQGKPVAAGQDVLRFSSNLVLGVGGLFDVATRFGIPENDEDFGQTVGRWGVTGPGPYLVFPGLGPSSTREAVTVTLDFVFAPWNYLLPVLARDAPHRIQRRRIDAAYAEALERRGEPLDFYGFVRVAYRKDIARRTRDEPEFVPPTEAELDRLPAPGEGPTPWVELRDEVPVY